MPKRIWLVSIIIFSLFINIMPAKDKEKPSKTVSDLLSDCYVNGICEFDKNNYSKAAEYFRKFLDKKPSCNKINIMIKDAFKTYQETEINLVRGEELYNRGHYDQAYPFFEKILDLVPNHTKAKNYLQKCYKNMEVRIRILDEPTADGQEIKEKVISRDAELKLFAVAYDKDGSFLGPIRVRWITTGELAKISSYPIRKELNFSPLRINKKGTVKAILFKDTVAETGIITTSDGKAVSVKIFDVPDPVGKEVDFINLRSGEKITLYAHGFDKNNEYVGVVPIAWSATGSIDKEYRRYFSSFEYTSKKAGKGLITIVTKNRKSRNIRINISPSDLYYLQIEDAPDGKGYEIFS
ncbi:MAG: hypothetical protein KKH98_05345, partial [Spirochaetes bacterium]|nr:hypothetical protein [Spirochaetota bacterium]